MLAYGCRYWTGREGFPAVNLPQGHAPNTVPTVLCLTPTYEYSGEHQRDPFRILFYIGVSSGELILLTNDQTRK